LRGIEIDLVNPDSILSLVSVPDAADAIIKSCFAPPDIINIAGPPLSLKVFFERAFEARGFQPNLVLKYDRASEMRLRFDLNKANRVLGWNPTTDPGDVFSDMASTLGC
jgi:nucleoside-diphosphate-sugar epimerase